MAGARCRLPDGTTDNLAVRLPADLVNALGLQVNDEVQLVVDEPCCLAARWKLDVDGLLQQLRRFRGKLPANFRLSRDETRP